MISLLKRRKAVELVIQTEVAECGLACLAMVASFHGLELDLGSLRRRFTPPSRGASLAALSQCAEQLGFVVRPLRIELEHLSSLSLPAILHWNFNHFVVIEQVRGGKALIHDPAARSLWLEMNDVSSRFTGVALEMVPSHKFEPGHYRHRMRLSQLWSKAPGLLRGAVQVLALSGLFQVLGLLLPYFSQLAIDRSIAQQSQTGLNALALGFGLIAFIHGMIFWLRSRALLASGASLGYGLSVNLARRMFRLPVSWFNNRHVGDIMARFESLRPVRKALTEDIAAGFIDGAFALLTLILMALYSPLLALIPIIFGCCLISLRAIFFKAFRKANEAAIVFSGKEQSSLIETLHGIRALRLSNKATNRELRWRNKLVQATNAEVSVQTIDSTQGAAKLFLLNLENVIFLWAAFSLTLSGAISLGSAFAVYAYKAQFTTAISALIENFWRYKLMDMHLDRIADIALTPEDIRYNQPPRPHRSLTGKIELRDIHYRYSEFDAPVLRGVSFVIQPGESVALTGPSGHGKSTVAQIVLGLLPADAGSFLVDDMPVEVFGYDNFYRSVGAVLQDDKLFAGSIFENISLFDDEADIDQVRKAAQLADIDADVMAMPMGYETLVGELGSAVSGGQKQRILLARALFQAPRFLVIDEGTSHLDQQSEARVNEAIASLGITRLIIAHREATILSADRVLHIQNGIVDGLTRAGGPLDLDKAGCLDADA